MVTCDTKAPISVSDLRKSTIQARDPACRDPFITSSCKPSTPAPDQRQPHACMSMIRRDTPQQVGLANVSEPA